MRKQKKTVEVAKEVPRTAFGRKVRPVIMFEPGVFSSAEVNYHAGLKLAEEMETSNSEIGLVGAELLGEFTHTSELIVMTYNEAMATKDVKNWKLAVLVEH